MDSRTLSALEFDALKELIAASVRTPSGRRCLDALRPSPDPREVARRKARTEEAMRRHPEGGRLGPGSVDDPDPILAQLRPEGAVLEAIAIARLVGVIQAADSVRQGLAAERQRWPCLWEVASGIPDLRVVTRAIAGRIAADGRVEDSASPELARVRRRIAQLESRLERSLQSILEHAGERNLLQDSYVTIRNGRMVIPVRAEARASVPGIVHGASGTGATVFVEPMETLEPNNELVTARDQEVAEIHRLLTEWSALLRSRLTDIEAACARLGELDLLGAMAVFGVGYHCIVADEADADRVLLIDARHPVLESTLHAKGVSPVPLTLEMPARAGVLVLSGPNAGGKTVALKTIGLLALMNQAGIPVPAVEARLPVFDQVMADIGDHQSILESLSTFSARMVRVAEMSRELSPPALVLVDEVGAGTDPEEAGALAVAIVDHFRRRGASVVTTTHHEALKAYAELAEGAINAAMEVDEKTMRPTYHLMTGVAGRSGGIDLAERVGLPADVVAEARSRLSSGHRETLEYSAKLKDLAESKRREEETLRRKEEELEARRVALESQLEETIVSARARWHAALEMALRQIEEAREQFISGIKDRAVALQVRAEARRQSSSLREQLEQVIAPLAPTAPPAARPGAEDIRPGMRVRVAGMTGSDQAATVESVDAKGRAEVLVRGKRVRVRLVDLRPAETEPAAGKRLAWTVPPGVRLQRRDVDAAPTEINLIGERVEEALERLDKFLDDAYLAGHAEARIIHGHGTGRLRAAVRSMLDDHPHVEKWAAADERVGGDGVTVAVLRG